MNLQDADALRWMQTGTPEIAFIWPPFIGRDAPDLASLYVYGSVSGAEEHLRALPAVKEAMIDGFAERNIPVVGFMALPIIDASLFCRRPVTSLDELRGVKLTRMLDLKSEVARIRLTPFVWVVVAGVGLTGTLAAWQALRPPPPGTADVLR